MKGLPWWSGASAQWSQAARPMSEIAPWERITNLPPGALRG